MKRTENHYFQHLFMRHTQQILILCHWCQKLFAEPPSAVMHVSSHKDEPDFTQRLELSQRFRIYPNPRSTTVPMPSSSTLSMLDSGQCLLECHYCGCTFRYCETWLLHFNTSHSEKCKPGRLPTPEDWCSHTRIVYESNACSQPTRGTLELRF